MDAGWSCNHAFRHPVACAGLRNLTSGIPSVDPRVAGNRDIDPEGIEIAAQRDAEIEFGVVQTIGHAEFLRLAGGSSE